MSDGQGPLPRTKESRWERPQSDGQQVEQVRASHLLVKHRDSRRPASWRSVSLTLCLFYEWFSSLLYILKYVYYSF
jgi:hypothetical protein